MTLRHLHSQVVDGGPEGHVCGEGRKLLFHRRFRVDDFESLIFLPSVSPSQIHPFVSRWWDFPTSMYGIRPDFWLAQVGADPRTGTLPQIYVWYSKQPYSNGCLVKHTFFYVNIWNHPTKTTSKTWLLRVPGIGTLCHVTCDKRCFEDYTSLRPKHPCFPRDPKMV